MRIEFKPGVLSDLGQSEAKEWLITNGIGGYASSTVIGLNTRKYHGLLIAEKDDERRLLLSKLEEEIDGTHLSTNQYPNTIYPEGYKLQRSFELNPLPKFVYETGDAAVEKTICMKYGENTTIARYRIKSKQPVTLSVRPFVNYRSIHSLTTDQIEFQEGMNKKGFSLGLDGKPVLHVTSDKARYERTDLPDRWYRNMEYLREMERGYDFRESQFAPGEFRIECEKEAEFHIIASDKRTRKMGEEAVEEEAARINALAAFGDDGLRNRLAQAADTFIVRKGKLYTIYAGYPWFGAWGRDAMISLEGLLLATKRPDIAKKVLEHFSMQIKEGKAPNRMGKENTYNAIDAGLWHIHAVSRFLQYTNDYAFVKKKLWANIKKIMEAIPREEGHVIAGDESKQLTWMDAIADGKAVTSRNIAPVEVQALWYNALMVADALAGKFGEKGYQEEAAKAKEALNGMYNGKYLDDSKGDSTLRPNQLVAFTVDNKAFGKEEAKSIAESCGKLLTPYGLRTLPEDSPKYRGRYEGNENERSKAYHQGSIWPWLTGPWNDTLEAAGMERQRPKALEASLLETGLGSIPELFDGSQPHTPRGCISQAWSVAELLRSIK